jgi:hypothetical protein
MHHFIYPSKDTYITNRSNYEDKNFGIDELLQVGTANTIVRTLSSTKDYVYTDVVFNTQGVTSFTGTLTGSFSGTVSSSYGTISGSGLIFSASFFSGSVDGTGSVGSGSFGNPASGSTIIGSISGSVIAPYLVGVFTGVLSGSSGCLSGTGSGVDTRNVQNWVDATTKFIDRTFLKFDLTAISTSIANGEIATPHFSLKVKVCNEYELPITYNIYALPISQSWDMGNGYYSDGGSDRGVSWQYRDNNGGTTWYSQSLSGSRPAIDFITDPASATASFAYGGGTFYTSSVCSQSFEYQSSDINMDVTPIVLGWLSGSLPNEGLMLVSSDELHSTGSGFTLRFFSRDTNTIYSPCLDVMWDDIALNGGDITGSISTGSVTIATASAGITASVQSGSTFTIAGGISGSFSASAVLTITQNFSASVLWPELSASGIVSGGGLSGNIIGLPVYGFVSASISGSSSFVQGPCGNNFYAQMSSGSFLNGIWSGSTFTAYYVDYKFENAFLTGSWTPDALYGSRVYIGIPSGIEPYAYATVVGTYVNGRALGTYTLSGSTSASFNGQFIDGNLLGGVLSLQLSGSVVTSSYSYTSSVEFTSSVLSPLDSERPFTVTLSNVSPTYKAGDIVKMNVFGRKQFPLKTFGKSTQQQQYLVPEYLPTSSYYALKDNETSEILMDFDNYTRIGCMYPEGNYFVIDTTALPQERYYRVLIRVNDGTSIHTIDTGKTFKVTR